MDFVKAELSADGGLDNGKVILMKEKSVENQIEKLKKSGEKVIGCFPLYPPVELFASMGLVPAVLWNLKKDVENLSLSDLHLQSYACSIAREMLEFILSDKGDMFDALFAYNACDTLRNLPEIVVSANKKAKRDIPLFNIHIPQVNRQFSDPSQYIENEIDSLIKKIEAHFDTAFSEDTFTETATAYSLMRNLIQEAEILVSKGKLSFLSFCETVLSGYTASAKEQIDNLHKLISKASDPVIKRKKKIIISGIMPPPLPVIEKIEDSGFLIASNDIASLKRTYGYSPAVTDNPGKYYADLYENSFPCTTLLYQGDKRIKAFFDLIYLSEVDGVIFAGEKFCEYEYFEFPYLEKELKKRGIPYLNLEFGTDDRENFESHFTRIEAFAEMISMHAVKTNF